ncbi:MAG: RecX family transcriptional regulator [Candidatus Levybacteria bacterium]|nr:RecX family transcriptional regulator [Candidatus Levybacteria bacterium]
MEVFDKFYNKALRFLSYRPRSEKEVRENLKKKKTESVIIEKIILKLKEQNFINDEEFVKWWIEQRTTVRPKGLRVIKLELKQKGIDTDLRLKINDFEQAKKLIEKKATRYKGLTKQELYRKLGGFLSRRGFDYDTIKKSIDEVTNKGV